jgi:hypothetical protein
VRRGLALAVIALLLGGCVTPATGSDSYRDKAVTSVRAATSEVATTSLTVRLLLRRRIIETYADVTITAAEVALGSISATFDSVQPPVRDDGVRDRVSTLLTDADDAVADARIAARRSDAAGLRRAQRDLRGVSRRLAGADQALS